jgi:DNA modification methylase
MIDTEWRRVLKPSGSLWLNLGDKYSGAGWQNHGRSAVDGEQKPLDRSEHYQKMWKHGLARPKSLLGLPWRIALQLIDAGWILRAELIWSKPNGLPESVQDRVRRSHEQWFHFTLEPRYYSAVDEIREEYTAPPFKGQKRHDAGQLGETDNPVLATLTEWDASEYEGNPLGKLPGSVWTIPTEPLTIPDATREALGLVDHYAAFPQEWPRRLILGWSPSGVCTECGEGRRPDTQIENEELHRQGNRGAGKQDQHGNNRLTKERVVSRSAATITGYSCDCETPDAPTRPAVILDPFVGTGTTVGVAHILGRHGIGIDLSADYLRLAAWRIEHSGHFTKTEQRTAADRQGTLL